MSEFTRIVLCLAVVLTLVYAVVIGCSLHQGRGILFYICCIILNILTGLWFWYISSRPSKDPQAGMGLGPVLFVCGIITVAVPFIALVVFVIRYFFI